jgi:hypothetical protein
MTKTAGCRFGAGLVLAVCALGLAQAAPAQSGATSVTAASGSPAKPIPAGISHEAGAVHRPLGGAIQPLEGGKTKPHMDPVACKELGGEIRNVGSVCLSGYACVGEDESGQEHAVCITAT